MKKLSYLFIGAFFIFSTVASATVAVYEDPYEDDASIVHNLNMSYDSEQNLLNFSWDEYTGTDFKYYKLVWSQTDDTPSYPENDYLMYTTDVNETSYSSAPKLGTTYYRVCSLTNDGRRGCSNTLAYVGTEFVESSDVEPSELSAVQLADGTVKLSWTEYEGSGFNGYKVVHSTTNADLRYPDDSYIKYITDKDTLSYVHTTVEEGTNYYRICTLSDGPVVCSNVVTITSVVDLSDEEKSSDSYSDTDEISFNLEAEIVEDTVELSWDKYEGGDLKWYKVVRSVDNPLPYYPNDGYIGVLSYANDVSFVDDDPISGGVYYRVCVITTSDERGCSNVVEINYSGAGDMPFDSYFPDTTDHWSKEYVNDLAQKDIVTGVQGKFLPDENVSRSEAIKMMMYAYDMEGSSCDASLFPDMDSGDWFCTVVSYAVDKHFVDGDGGYLYPSRDLTRAEAVKILIEIRGDQMAMVTMAPFSDVDPDSWYAKYVKHAKSLGLVGGYDGEFKPSKFITRAELAKIISVSLEKE